MMLLLLLLLFCPGADAMCCSSCSFDLIAATCTLNHANYNYYIYLSQLLLLRAVAAVTAAHHYNFLPVFPIAAAKL